MSALRPTCDRKTRFWDGQQNTFGLMPGREGSCPGCTIGPGGCCEIREGRKLPSCYVNRTISYSRAAKNVLQANTGLLKGADVGGMEVILTMEFERFLAKELKRAKPQLFYRLHWSGDVFSVDYAKAIRAAVAQFPDIMFWNYTRSWFALPHLAGLPNMVQYLSLDAVNFDKGVEAYHSNGGASNRLAVCYMGDEKPKIPGIEFQDCPADTGESAVDGACARCRKCLLGTHIWFKQK